MARICPQLFTILLGVKTDRKPARGRGRPKSGSGSGSSGTPSLGRSGSGSQHGSGSRSNSTITHSSADKASSGNKYNISSNGRSASNSTAHTSSLTNNFSKITEAFTTTAANSEVEIAKKPEEIKAQQLSSEVYSHYYERDGDSYVIPPYEQSLPILEKRAEILEKLESHQCLIITGETGSGKSTQVPQYILDHYVQKNQGARIWVTQPRRIAALSIAERVADSRTNYNGKGWGKCGQGIVGYQVGLERNACQDSCIVYMTPGIVSNKMQSDRHLTGVTVLIIDEVHERDLETEMLLLLVKNLLAQNQEIKVLLMSGKRLSHIYLIIPKIKFRLSNFQAFTNNLQAFSLKKINSLQNFQYLASTFQQFYKCKMFKVKRNIVIFRDFRDFSANLLFFCV